MAMARIMLAVVLLCLCTQLIHGQSGNPAPVQVMTFQVSLESVTTVKSVTGDMIKGSNVPVSMGMDNEQQLVAVIKCTNVGGKDIKLIYLDFRYINQGSEILTFQSKTDKKIKSGKDAEVKVAMPLTSKQLAEQLKVGYRITKVEFADKSIWENSDNSDIKLIKFNFAQ